MTLPNTQSVCLSLSGEFSHVCYHNDWTAQLSDIDAVPEGCVIFATLVRDSSLSQQITILIARCLAMTVDYFEFTTGTAFN